MHTYTDIENTGLAAVPDCTDRTDARVVIAETVWSHRLDSPIDD